MMSSEIVPVPTEPSPSNNASPSNDASPANEPSPSNDGGVAEACQDWRTVAAALLAIARRRGELEVEEAGWLVAAERLHVHRHLGCVTLLEYFERVLGHSPRAGMERLRVARALQELPATRAALATGKIPFSGVRELTRVAIPATEQKWLEAAADKTVRQIEGIVAGRRPGDTPECEADLSLIKRVVRFAVSDQTYALLREAQRRIADDLGGNLDDDQMVAELARAVLGGRGDGDKADHGRAAYQLAITTCERCERTTQDAAGQVVEVDYTVLDQAECDAQVLRKTHVGTQRATQDVPPARRREIFRRDHGCCRVPGCRSARHLEIHHIVPRDRGGSDDASNLLLLCGGHHRAHHRGFIHIEGTGEAPRFFGLPGP